jgi:hypothetical protein
LTKLGITNYIGIGEHSKKGKRNRSWLKILNFSRFMGPDPYVIVSVAEPSVAISGLPVPVVPQAQVRKFEIASV